MKLVLLHMYTYDADVISSIDPNPNPNPNPILSPILKSFKIYHYNYDTSSVRKKGIDTNRSYDV